MIRGAKKYYHAMAVSDVVGFNIEDKEQVGTFLSYAETPGEEAYHLNLIENLRQVVTAPMLRSAAKIWNQGQIEAAKKTEKEKQCAS